jgi:hypothetical protein
MPIASSSRRTPSMSTAGDSRRAMVVRRAAEAAGPELCARSVVELYANTTPAVIRVGWGVERNRTAAVRSRRSRAARDRRQARIRGGGFTMSNGDARWGLTETAIDEGSADARRQHERAAARAAHAARPADRGPVVYNCNLSRRRPISAG